MAYAEARNAIETIEAAGGNFAMQSAANDIRRLKERTAGELFLTSPTDLCFAVNHRAIVQGCLFCTEAHLIDSVCALHVRQTEHRSFQSHSVALCGLVTTSSQKHDVSRHARTRSYPLTTRHARTRSYPLTTRRARFAAVCIMMS
jgi:hypothetical protein